MSESDARKFTPDQVNAILRRAIERQGSGATSSLTYGDLLDTARELGLDPEQINAAIADQERNGDIEGARAAYINAKKKKFRDQLRSYIVVNIFLLLLNVFLGGHLWFYWVLFGWGIGLYFSAADAFFPKERDIEKGALRILEREDRRRRKEQIAAGRTENASRKKSFTVDSKAGTIIIEHGDKRIKIG
jgi:hypothetical protein